MFEWIEPFLTSLNTLSPLGVIGLLGTIIFILVKGRTAVDGKIADVATNHLHGLPELVDTTKEISETMKRIELKIEGEFAFIRAKLSNGKTS